MVVAIVIGIILFLLAILLKKKALVVLAVVVLGSAIVIGVATKSNTTPATAAAKNIPAYQLIAPSVKDAPTVLRTSSRVYYVSTYKEDKQQITLTRFWVYDSKKWQLVTKPLVFDKAIYGGMKLYTR